jgi:hypothetical protein
LGYEFLIAFGHALNTPSVSKYGLYFTLIQIGELTNFEIYGEFTKPPVNNAHFLKSGLSAKNTWGLYY